MLISQKTSVMFGVVLGSKYLNFQQFFVTGHMEAEVMFYHEKS
jgi:hypothetical protein